MTSWVRKIKSPFKKAGTFFNQQLPNTNNHKKSHHHHHHQGGGNEHEHEDGGAMNLHGEVMACAYEDVQVMWSMLDKSKSRAIITSS